MSYKEWYEDLENYEVNDNPIEEIVMSEEKTIEEIRAEAPEGATHWDQKTNFYYKMSDGALFYFLDPSWGWGPSVNVENKDLHPYWLENVIPLYNHSPDLVKYFAAKFAKSEKIQLQMGETVLTPTKSSDEGVPGYEKLSDVFTRAYDQASKGKGKERHAGGKPFHEQPMQVISDMFDSPVGMYFQAIKKIRESHRLLTTEAQVRELLGAINYIAGIIIFLEKEGKDV